MPYPDPSCVLIAIGPSFIKPNPEDTNSASLHINAGAFLAPVTAGTAQNLITKHQATITKATAGAAAKALPAGWHSSTVTFYAEADRSPSSFITHTGSNNEAHVRLALRRDTAGSQDPSTEVHVRGDAMAAKLWPQFPNLTTILDVAADADMTAVIAATDAINVLTDTEIQGEFQLTAEHVITNFKPSGASK